MYGNSLPLWLGQVEPFLAFYCSKICTEMASGDICTVGKHGNFGEAQLVKRVYVVDKVCREFSIMGGEDVPE